MVKHFGTLASRALRVHQEMTPRLMRIQSGFMADKNIDLVEHTLQEMQEMLREMRQALNASEKTRAEFHPLK